MRKLSIGLLAAAMVALLAGGVLAGDKVVFKDAKGDDNGPGTYVYPTDAVYTAGSFDIIEFDAADKGDAVDFEVTVGAKLEDPWRMGNGFSIQMVFILIDNAPGGFTETPPGLNLMVDESTAWDKCVIISPQTAARVQQEIDAKAGDMASSIIVPKRVKGRRSSIVATVDKAQLETGDITTWKYEVLMSNEGFPRRPADPQGQRVRRASTASAGGTDFTAIPTSWISSAIPSSSPPTSATTTAAPRSWPSSSSSRRNPIHLPGVTSRRSSP
ncbi:MAG: glucodextranase DOMON-like domain-containing protein [Candidatus Krumholzibacteriia bacterium]